MSNSIIIKTFQSPLGDVVCKLTSNLPTIEKIETKALKNGKLITYQSSGHKIELIEFKIPQPLYNGETLTDSKGWIWRIEKTGISDECLTLNCSLNNYSENVMFDTATGEHLDAIEVSNDKWILHIGTEDAEALNLRAKTNDWFPKRLKNTNDLYKSITEIKKTGLVTQIPNLKKGERIQIHYLTAYDRKKEQSVNTWLAVDMTKKDLDNWIGEY